MMIARTHALGKDVFLQLVVGHVFYLFYNFFSPILFIHYIFIYFIFAFSLWPLEWLFFVANFYIVWLRHSFFFFFMFSNSCACDYGIEGDVTREWPHKLLKNWSLQWTLKILMGF